MRPRIDPGLLLAMPASSDVNLSRAVVMVVSHDEHGALGLVINRPSSVTVGEMFEGVGIVWRGRASVVFAGGPVAVQGLWVVFEEPGTGIMMTNLEAHLREIADKPPPNTRFILGHIDWAGGQLGDASRGAYYAPDPSFLFATPPEALWDRIQASGMPFERSIGSWFRGKLGLSPIPKATLIRRK